MAIYSGQPGTGKTFRLLSIGLMHAYAQKSVLFACFNKTLASDVRRLLQFEEKLKISKSTIDVVDITQLAVRCFDANGLSFKTMDFDDWGRMVVEELRKRGDGTIIDRYDTILVDEAHDMQDWQLDLIDLHACPNPTVVIALGKGQELYRDDSQALQWLTELAKEKDIIQKQLRRNFRNTSEQFFAALAFHECWPDKFARVHEIYKRSAAKGKSELEFDRNHGQPLQYIGVPALRGEFEDNGAEQLELVSEEYAHILNLEIDEIEAENTTHPVGLLVLVPDQDSNISRWVRAALEKATANRPHVSFIDYTDENARRSQASTSEIRLCTYHSARGLEGERVVIFGLESIDSLARATHVRAENLAFIALSRAVFRTVVVMRTYFSSPSARLLKEILDVQGA